MRLATPLGRTSPSLNGANIAFTSSPNGNGKPHVRPSGLIGDLLAELSHEQISYCHWKSNWKIDDWLAGKGDLDLLVGRNDVARFAAVIGRLGFRQALVHPSRELPGITNYYGYDAGSQQFVHIHAHYQLVLGHDATKNYRLPVEQSMLDAAVTHGPIRIASPEFELALFVIRMTLKYSIAETFARRLTRKLNRHNQAIADEIDYLRGRIGNRKFQQVMREHFPMVGRKVFDDCLNALRMDAATFEKVIAANRLKTALMSYSRSGRVQDSFVRSGEQAAAALRKLSLKQAARKRLESGGCLIALVGGDGSGKTTCADELDKWLSKKFETKRIHFGKPPKSAATLAVIGALRIRRWMEKQWLFRGGQERRERFDPFQPGVNSLQQLRWLCTARDRYRLHKKVRRFSSNGGIAVCDRWPIDKLSLMDGPRISRSLDGARPTKVQRFFITRERFYYERISSPDVLLVLRVDAATAAARKTDEPAGHVMPRAEELWRTDWNGTRAQVIDANRPLEEVLAEIRTLVWTQM